MWTRLGLWLADEADSPLAQFLFDAAAKATVLLAVAMVATVLLRRSSAAVRHRIWCLTFAALVILPGLSAALPEWRLAVLPYRSPLAPQAEGRSPLAPQAEPAPPTATPSPIADELARHALPLAEQAGYVAPLRGETSLHLEPPTVRRRLNLATLWLAGAFIALSPLVVGLARTLLLRRQARAIDDGQWTKLLDELRQRLALARRVGLYETNAPLMPMTWGLFRPVVMLPRHAREWTDRLRRTVLLHELAHVKRCDVGCQLLGRAACAMYWFHPLAWYALRRLRIERELACDDCVVLAGERASDYAAELLQIARSYRTVPFAAAVAMAQRSNLKHRLSALFDRACSHLPVSSRAARLLLAGVLLLVTTLAAIRFAPRASADDVVQPPSAATAENQPPEDDLVTVAGKVVDPDGKPLAGATVSALHWWHRLISYPPLAKTKCDSAGRFTVSFRKSEYAIGLGPADTWKEAMIVASAKGFGLAWIRWRDIPVGQELTLQLVDYAAIAGRVVDLEGRPIAGVEVKPGLIYAPSGGNLDAWLEAVGRGESNFTTSNLLAGPGLHVDTLLPQQLVTDRDGRFRLAGLGQERVVELSLHGPTIAYTEVKVVTRALKPMKQRLGVSDSLTVYGADLEIAASPTQPMEGVVRDADRGTPLAGVRIESFSFAGRDWSRLHVLGTTTDESGHYRLNGMPKGTGNELIAIPNDNQPYLMRRARVREQQSLKPVTVDIDLHRGIWIAGRVTDQATGQGVMARMYYWPFRSNPYAQALPEFDASLGRYGFEDRYTTRPDGSFRLVGLPGQGIVGAKCLLNRYRHGVGSEKIAGADEFGSFDTYLCPQAANKRSLHAMKQVEPPPGVERVACDLALDPGGTITVNVVDPDGRPLTGFEADGKSATWHGFGAAVQGSTFEVVELGPDETRTVVVRHKARKLVKAVNVRLADHPTGAMTAALAPAAKIVGRVVDQNGAPVPGASLELFWYGTGGGSNGNLGFTATDEHGRFEHADLPTGCIYNMQTYVSGDSRIYVNDLRHLASGETKDVGDIKVRRQVKPNANEAQLPVVPEKKVVEDADQVAAAQNNSKAEVVTLRGRVLLPDGRPAAGADLYWAQIESSQPPSRMIVTKRGATDGEGRFQIALAQNDMPPTVVPSSLVAHKPGFGIDWVQVTRGQVPPDVTLRLVEDRPLRGRVTDTEGRPVARARVTVGGVLAPRDGSLDSFLRAWKQSWRDSWMKLDRGGGLHAPLGSVMGAVTDDDGRFQLSGIGVERVATVEIRAARHAYEELRVVHRAGFDAKSYNRLTLSARTPPTRIRGMLPQLTGPVIEQVVEAELVIRGRVFTGASRAPVAGASVYSASGGWGVDVSAVTDADGRYELHGHPRNEPVLLGVHAPAPKEVLDRLLQFPAASTQAVLDADVELKRGIVVEGRVFDRITGKGVHAGLRFAPLPGNHFADQADCEDPTTATVDDEGHFRMLAMPGPGVLLVQVYDGQYLDGRRINPYRQASFSPEDSQRVPTTVDGDDRFFTGIGGSSEFLMTENAVKVIDLAAGGKPVTCDLPVDPGKTVKIAIEDEQGQPVSDAFVSGFTDTGPIIFRVAKPSCTIYALGPDPPRRVCVLHPERRLAASITLTGEERGPVTVRLAASASIGGRALDSDGQPIADALVQINYARRSASEILRFARLGQAPMRTDRDGRFQVENIMPGERFALDFKQGDTFFRAPLTAEQRELQAAQVPLAQWVKQMIGMTPEQYELGVGQKLKLGDVKTKELR